mmetsp:Transcript_71088/g.123295  ORF Transcript_71088/g.123295 Transcript_71088/m.123295 type:complete len:104 (+) Transcript_71088:110-421(+)
MKLLRITCSLAAVLALGVASSKSADKMDCPSGDDSCGALTDGPRPEGFDSLGDETSFMQTFTVVHKRGGKRKAGAATVPEQTAIPNIQIGAVSDEELDDYVSF